MAKIPTVTGTGQITRQPLAARQGAGVFSTSLAKATQESAQGAARVAQQFEEAQTLAETTNAGTVALRKTKELELEASEARTIEDIAKFRTDYPNRITKIREESNKLITLPQAKDEFGRSFDRDNIITDFNIRKTLQTNQNFALESILNESILEQRDSFINAAGTPEEIVRIGELAEINRDTLLNDALNRNTLDPEKTRTNRAAQQLEWRLARMDAHIERDAETFLEEVRKGKKGIYGDVGAKDRLAKEGKAKTKMDRNKVIADKLNNEKWAKNELDSMQKYFAIDLFPEDNQAQFFEGNISQQGAAVLDLVLNSPNAADATTDDDKEGKLIDKFYALDESDIDKLRAFRIEVMATHGAGDLEFNDAKFLINKTVDPFTQKKKDAKNWFQSAIAAGKAFARSSDVDQAKIINKLLHRVDEKSTEEAIVKATQDIITEEQRSLYPGFEPEDLEGTAKELNMTVKQVFDAIQKRDGIEE